MRKQIYLDCDGVLADFDAGAKRILGMGPAAFEERHDPDAVHMTRQGVERLLHQAVRGWLGKTPSKLTRVNYRRDIDHFFSREQCNCDPPAGRCEPQCVVDEIHERELHKQAIECRQPNLCVDLHGDPVFVVREVCSYGVLPVEEFILGHHRLEDQRFDLADPCPDSLLSFVHDAHGVEFILKETLDNNGVIDLQIGKVHRPQV